MSLLWRLVFLACCIRPYSHVLAERVHVYSSLDTSGSGNLATESLAELLGKSGEASSEYAQAQISDQCDAEFQNPMGEIVVGVFYNRKDIMKDQLDQFIGDKSWRKWISFLARNDLAANAIGIDHDNIMDKIVNKAGGKTVDAASKYSIDMAMTGFKTSQKDEKGMLLLELKICRISDSARLFQCTIGKKSAFGEGGFLHGITKFLWDATSTRFQDTFSKILLNTVKAKLPSKVMQKMQQKGVTDGANVCVFDGPIGDREKKMFKKLKKCPQARAGRKNSKPNANVTSKVDDPCKADSEA